MTEIGWKIDVWLYKGRVALIWDVDPDDPERVWIDIGDLYFYRVKRSELIRVLEPTTEQWSQAGFLHDQWM
jgi:hypothetical protein